MLNKSKLEFELILVDDASTDGSVEYIKSLQTTDYRLQLIKKPKNEGFASTVDAGIRAAKGEYVFTLKTDTVPDKAKYFQILLDHFESRNENGESRNDLFAVSATLKTIENGKEEIRGCGQIYFERGFFLHSRKILNTQYRIQNTAWADGSASVFNKEIYLKIGGFDSLFNPFYWEDVDLGYRAWKCGYTIEYEPNATLLHDFEEGAIGRHYTKSQVKYIALRNQFLFLWENADFIHVWQHIIWWPYHAAVAIKNQNWDFFRAHLWIKLQSLTILKRRLTLKRLVKISDARVLKNFQN